MLAACILSSVAIVALNVFGRHSAGYLEKTMWRFSPTQKVASMFLTETTAIAACQVPCIFV